MTSQNSLTAALLRPAALFFALYPTSQTVLHHGVNPSVNHFRPAYDNTTQIKANTRLSLTRGPTNCQSESGSIAGIKPARLQFFTSLRIDVPGQHHIFDKISTLFPSYTSEYHFLMLVSHGYCHNMNSQHHPYAAAQVAEKVMRRVEIAKVAHPALTAAVSHDLPKADWKSSLGCSKSSRLSSLRKLQSPKWLARSNTLLHRARVHREAEEKETVPGG